MLKTDNITLTKALAALTKQTGIRVENDRGAADIPIALDLSGATFWQALDAIAASAKGRVTLYPSTGRIVLEKRGPNYRPAPVCYDGRFRLSVKRVTAVRDPEINDNDPGRGLTSIAVEVAWDPELQPLYLETRPRAVRVVDDLGRVYIVPDEGSSLAPVDGRIAQAVDLHLPPLPRSATRIRSLQGELSAVGPNKMLAFRFDTLDRLAGADANAPERRQTLEGVTCRVVKVTIDRGRWTVKVALDYPPDMNQLDSNQSWVVNNEMTLESPDGAMRVPSSTYVLESATPRQAVLSYHFRDKGGAPRGKPGDWKLSYRTPERLIELPIKFSFKDIPLP
jgi:hypothetical protein